MTVWKEFELKVPGLYQVRLDEKFDRSFMYGRRHKSEKGMFSIYKEVYMKKNTTTNWKFGVRRKFPVEFERFGL